MTELQKVAIGRIVMRSKERLVAIRPVDGLLCLETMRYADEVRAAVGDVLPPIDEDSEPTERELEMARQLVRRSLEADFEPEKYHDAYREELLALIDKKAAGEEIVEPSRSPRSRARCSTSWPRSKRASLAPVAAARTARKSCRQPRRRPRSRPRSALAPASRPSAPGFEARFSPAPCGSSIRRCAMYTGMIETDHDERGDDVHHRDRVGSGEVWSANQMGNVLVPDAAVETSCTMISSKLSAEREHAWPRAARSASSGNVS